MGFYRIYCSDIPDFISELAQCDELLRLKGAGMDCGCEYSSFPQFADKTPADRYDHSIGVALIVWNFTHEPRQAIAGLLHDIATPAFSHVVDFVHGDHLHQEATEGATADIIKNSSAITGILNRHGIDVDDVVDYHRYPVADNDIPHLSADRLEYTLKNLTRYGNLTVEDVRRIYGDLTVGVNETEEPELMFCSPDVCHDFVMAALPVFELYSSDADRYCMEVLAIIIRRAFERGILNEDDLYSGESTVIGKLCSDNETARLWKDYTALNRIEVRYEQPEEKGWLSIPVKKRYVDPMVQGLGRATVLFDDYRDALDRFLRKDLNYWIKGNLPW